MERSEVWAKPGGLRHGSGERSSKSSFNDRTVYLSCTERHQNAASNAFEKDSRSMIECRITATVVPILIALRSGKSPPPSLPAGSALGGIFESDQARLGSVLPQRFINPWSSTRFSFMTVRAFAGEPKLRVTVLASLAATSQRAFSTHADSPQA